MKIDGCDDYSSLSVMSSPPPRPIQGSYLLTKQEPMDQLRQLLLNYGPDSEDVKSFFNLHKEQACATCLTLACNQEEADPRVSFVIVYLELCHLVLPRLVLVQVPIFPVFQVTEMATRAFFLYGGQPEYNFNAGSGPGMTGISTGAVPYSALGTSTPATGAGSRPMHSMSLAVAPTSFGFLLFYSPTACLFYLVFGSFIS